jgi:SpoVK/Ycf46/Vps4 family AAA+-type ATPase
MDACVRMRAWLDERWVPLRILPPPFFQVRTSTRTPILSVLLEGAASTGKTAIAASLGMESEFPFVRVVSADAMVGFTEGSKVSKVLVCR